MHGVWRARMRVWLPKIAILLPLMVTLAIVWVYLRDPNVWLAIFMTIFILRYTRFIGNFIGGCMYQPSLVYLHPAFTPNSVTVILPTVDPNGPDFLECVTSILSNDVAALIVVTVGSQLKAECRRVLEPLHREAGHTRVSISAIDRPSKRRQIAHVMPQVTTAITILADDHVFWPTRDFVPSILAPFENRRVGMVATRKRVRRTTPGKWSWASIVNFIACNYLERHNWELRASNAIDGGVFVISGRTAAYRTEFLADQELLHQFCNETFFFGLIGGKTGLGPDDDNFLTRKAMEQGWQIKFQDTFDATIETTLGEWPKFNGQLLRWARTTFRSNPVMLRKPLFLHRYSWSAFMVYLAGITNFALLWDGALITSAVMAHKVDPEFPLVQALVVTVFWMLFTKIVKVLPVLLRNPADWSLLIFQLIFGYVHSFYKFWALVTFWNCEWSGRNLDGVENAENAQALLAVDHLFN